MCGSATISIHSGHKLAFAMAISQIAWQVAYRRYVRRNAVAIYGLGWGSAQCSMLGGLGEGCSMPHCSFSPQCQCRHKSHEFLQQYVSEARNMQFIETKHTQFWGKFDHLSRDGCNMKMLPCLLLAAGKVRQALKLFRHTKGSPLILLEVAMAV